MSDLIKELSIYTVDGNIDTYKNAKMKDVCNDLMIMVTSEDSKYPVFYYNRNIVKMIIAMEE